MPRERAMSAYVLANCTQNPRLVSRNATVPLTASVRFTLGS
jgi:hypothetical protein